MPEYVDGFLIPIPKKKLGDYLRIARKAAKVWTCTLLDKPSRREVEAGEVDFVGFAIPDVFVVGYGIDYVERYRELPFIGKVEA